MINTLVAILIAVFLFLWPHPVTELNPLFFAPIAIIATLLFLGFIFAAATSWSVLLTAELNLTSHLTELFRRDLKVRAVYLILFLFPMLSYALVADLLFFRALHPHYLIPLWFILLGISLDTFRYYFRRVSYYLDPFKAFSLFSKKAFTAIRNDSEREFCDWVDALSDLALSAIFRKNVALSTQAIDEMQSLMAQFLDAVKKLGHSDKDQKLGIPDKASYSLFFVLQRFEMLLEQAVYLHFEPITHLLVKDTGKIVISAAKCDITLAPHPLEFLGRFAIFAIRHDISEAGPKATCVLLNIAKAIIEDLDVRYLELQATYFSLIMQMQKIAQEIFKKDKNINIKILTHPFLELKKLFQTEKMATHPDTTAIVHEIDRVLQEFAALESVMRTIPNISGLHHRATETQDKQNK